MSRVIINTEEGIEDELALYLVHRVVSGGCISDEGRTYCYLTVLHLEEGKFTVTATRNPGSDSFKVRREGP